MNSIKNYLKKYWSLIIFLCGYIIVFALLFSIFTNNDFIIGNDSLCQYRIFYQEWIKIVDNFIKNHTFNTYSFNMFLGTDFYSSMGYYCTGDIFMPIIYLFKNNIDIGLIIETILCVLLSGITMSIFLEYAGIKKKNVILYISIIYAIAGHSIFYIQVYMFHRFYAFLPLLFYGALKYFNEKKKSIFIISVAILFMQNFYFMYPTLIVLFFYCLIECFKRKYDLKNIGKDFIILLLCIFIGFFVSSFITLPSIIYTYKNAISRTAFNHSLTWNIKTFFGLIFSFLFSNPAGAIPDIFGTNNYYEDNQNMFMTIVSFIFLIYFLVKRNKHYKYEKILFILLTVIIIIKPLDSVMHGFAEPSLRWMFLYSFYALYLTALGMDEYSDIEIKTIINIGLCIIGFLILCTLVIFLIINRNRELVNLKIHLNYIFVCLLASLCLLFIMFKNIKYSAILSIVFVLFVNLFYTLKVSVQNGSTAIIDSYEIDFCQNYDTKYFRYYLSNIDSYYGIPHDCNNSLVYNIMSTSTYSSTIETIISPFLDSYDSRLFLDWGIEISDHNLLTMLGTKYYILGEKYKAERGFPNYEQAYSLNAISHMDVFFNPDYKGFGYTANNVKYLSDYSGNTKDYVDYVLVDDQKIDISYYQNKRSIPLNVIYMGENTVVADIDLQEDNILFIPIPNNPGWEIYVNDEIIEPISVNGGFIGIELQEGYNMIKMSFRTPYLKTGILLSLIGLALFVVNIKLEKKHNVNINSD